MVKFNQTLIPPNCDRNLRAGTVANDKYSKQKVKKKRGRPKRKIAVEISQSRVVVSNGVLDSPLRVKQDFNKSKRKLKG